MEYKEVIEKLKSLANPKNVEGMARFGISSYNTLGISIPNVREIAKKTGRNHELAPQLWKSGYHEARILAGIIDIPSLVTEKQMESWVLDFDSWDVCDQVCMNLFDKTEFAVKKAYEWSSRKEEFVKRAGFALMAALSFHDKKMKDSEFAKFFPVIKRECNDDRIMVKKAVNWALRQIGKRNLNLNKIAVKTAEYIQKQNSKAAKWIANDALRELKSEAVKKRLKNKKLL